MTEFPERNAFGKSGQDILINFLERHFGYVFEAGERNGNILNTDLIEEIENCEYVPPTLKRGARLKFKRQDKEYILAMPDVLMSRNSNLGFYWIEAKRHQRHYPKLIINKNSFDDYKILYEKFTRQLFYVMCIVPEQDGFVDVYHCEFGNLLNSEGKQEVINENNVYSWMLEDVMKKLNKYPINVSKYE